MFDKAAVITMLAAQLLAGSCYLLYPIMEPAQAHKAHAAQCTERCLYIFGQSMLGGILHTACGS